MPSSPKRKSEAPAFHGDEADKRARTADQPNDSVPISTTAAPDSFINHGEAIKYWSSTEASVNGMLGGYPQVSRVDLQASKNLLAKLRRQSKHHPPSKALDRAADCGAGIGRITKGFLSNVAQVVDIIEPVKAFTDQIKKDERGAVGDVYNVGLEAWYPDRTYDLIWNQWCVGQLTDAQFVDYLQRLPKVLSEGGWIVVKENLSNNHLGEDVYDETDSSVTRTDEKFRMLFGQAGLKLVLTELQKGFPKDLYHVRMYALQPK